MHVNTTDGTKTTTLSEAVNGSTVRVVRLHGGRGFRENLERLGLLPGVLLQIAGKGPAGPVIVVCRGGRIAIGRGMAERIEVAPEESAS